jgi:hypothetical protein
MMLLERGIVEQKGCMRKWEVCKRSWKGHGDRGRSGNVGVRQMWSV